MKMWTGQYLVENTQSVLVVFGGVGKEDVKKDMKPAEDAKDGRKSPEGGIGETQRR